MPSTQDAKEFLSEQFPDLNPGQWKRLRKFKDEAGRWVRQFQHAGGDTVELVESAGSFQVRLPNNLQDTPAFSSEELQGARELLRAFRKHSDEHDEDESAIEDHPLRLRYAHALPGIMSFYFPEDVYHNGEVDDDPLGPAKGLAVVFFETAREHKDREGYEYYYQWLLTEQASDGMDLMDENHHELTGDGWGTVAQAIAKLEARGFTHAKHLCMFSKAPSCPRPAMEQENLHPAHSQAIDAINSDDATALAVALDLGLSIDARLGNNDTLLATATKRDKKACFDLLVARGAIDTPALMHALMETLHQGANADRYLIPLLQGSWDFHHLDEHAVVPLGKRVLHNAMEKAMGPSGKSLLPRILDICRAKTDDKSYAGAFFHALAHNMVAQRNPQVRQEVERLLKGDPSLLLDPEASIIPPLVKRGEYSMAADWIIRHRLPVEAISVDGQPLLTYLQDTLEQARQRMTDRNRGGFVVVKVDRQDRVIPWTEDIQARELPRVLERLQSANRRRPGL